jgi:ABC-type polysaccharide/polyol phosphate transport system ATPase subunit
MSSCALRQSAGSDGDATPAVDYVVDIVGLSKSFQRKTRSKGSYTTLKSSLLNLFRRTPASVQVDPPVTQAIKDLTMRIPRGSSVGLIGRNGSGKSTFLKLVTGIYKPTTGRVSVLGRVAALIELGAGFHPDFTGRENLMLAGVMHGLTKEQVLERFDEIVSFAELEDVIDDPVRTYSSGMFMRLGFSVAVHTDPDILLVDEVLAVGDAGFVAKCKDRIGELRKQGKTLILVTHDLDSVERWCDEAIWLHQGEVKDRGFPRRVIDAYRQFIERGEEEEILTAEHSHAHSPEAGDTPHAESARWGSREIEITGVHLVSPSGDEKRVFHPNDGLTIRVEYKINSPEQDIVFGIGINRGDGLTVLGTNTAIDRVILPGLREAGVVECAIEKLGILDGSYSIDVSAHRADGYPFDYHQGALNFSVRSENKVVGVITPERIWRVNNEVCRCG